MNVTRQIVNNDGSSLLDDRGGGVVSLVAWCLASEASFGLTASSGCASWMIIVVRSAVRHIKSQVEFCIMNAASNYNVECK